MFSVVIPMYNSEQSIQAAIMSVLGQSKRELIKEIIVVNDGSTDESVSIVESIYDKDISIIIIDKKNGGVSSARNVGVFQAKEKWIALLDSDDLWLEKKIEKQFNLISNDNEIVCLGGPFNNKGVSLLGKKIQGVHKAKVSEICLTNFPQPSTSVFKKEVFLAVGGFDENQRYAEDGNFFLKVCGKFSLHYYSELLIEYSGGKRGFGISGLSSNIKEMYLGNIKNIQEMCSYGYITKSYYLFLRILYLVKHLRRMAIVRFETLKNSTGGN